MSNPAAFSHDEVLTALPEPRLRPYLEATGGDPATALELYAWNAQMAGAALEQLSHLEVMLRHAIDARFSAEVDEQSRGIPWFLLPPYYSAQSATIDEVRARLRGLNCETRDQVIAGLSFGFWTGWLGTKYEELWRKTLHKGFPHGTGRRKEVSVLAEQIRKFRNRVAHHDSLLNVDVGFEMQAVFTLAAIISPAAANWMRSVDRSRDMGRRKPVTIADTVVVPASGAWALYGETNAYICQPGRFFQQVDHLAFYANRHVQREVPKIKLRRDNVLWNEAEAERLLSSTSPGDKQVGRVIQQTLARGWPAGLHQVFLLTEPGEPGHVTLSGPLPNRRKGKSSGFVRKHRYTSVHQLQHATTVWDLAGPRVEQG